MPGVRQSLVALLMGAWLALIGTDSKGEESAFRVTEVSGNESLPTEFPAAKAFEKVVEFLEGIRPGMLALESTAVLEEPSKSFVLLRTSGDRIAAESVTLDEDVIHASAMPAAAPQALSLPVDEIRAIVLPAARGADDRDRLIALLESHRFKNDVLILEGVDRLTGEILKVTPDHVQFEAAAGRVDVATTRTRAVAFNRDLWMSPRSVKCRIAIVTKAGSVLSSEHCEANSRVVRLNWNEGASLAIPMTAVRRMVIYGPDVTRLSSLEPQAVGYTPFLPGAPGEDEKDRVVRMDRAVRGSMLSVRGRVFTHGIGAVSGTNVRYEIPASAGRFHATVGVDDAAGPEGSVTFRVALDDQAVWSSGVLGSDDPAENVDVPLGKAKSLSLIVDYGPDGDVNDLADWCEPIFLGSRKD
jgi:hypothetical protein